MRNSNRTTDGMFVRRRSSQAPQAPRRPSIDSMRVSARFLSDTHASRAEKNMPPTLKPRQAGDKVAQQIQYNKAAASAVAQVPAAGLRKPVDIDLTLDDEGDNRGKDSKKKHRGFRFRKPSGRAVKWAVIVLILVIVGTAGFFGYRILVASSHIFKGNVLAGVFSSQKPLKTDQYGRTNLLVFGTSESDPGHPGAELTDSIMIISIDQKANTSFIASVPRDLWVKYDSACSFGYQGKINTVYECANPDGSNEDGGQQALATKVGETFGVDIQYTVHLNLAVIKDAVDALGGIDITIDSPDPRGILDRNFDWRCNYTCYLVKYPNGPAHLDGEHAMWLAQARNDAGGYGLPRSNFDREANQRKIVIAMKEKATSVGFLANPVAVTNFIESLGNNIHTNIDASEIKTFISVAKNLDTKNIQSVSIIDQNPAILTTSTAPDGSSDVEPTSGIFDYSSISKFMKLELSGLGDIATEAAKVDVLNGSGVSGAATALANTLENNDGMTIGNVASAPQITGKYQLYDLSGGKKPATLKKLQQVLGLSAPTGTKLPTGISSSASFVVILGPDAAGSGSSSGN